jgi:cobalamin biosynthesis protein CobT
MHRIIIDRCIALVQARGDELRDTVVTLLLDTRSARAAIRWRQSAPIPRVRERCGVKVEILASPPGRAGGARRAASKPGNPAPQLPRHIVIPVGRRTVAACAQIWL